MMVERAEIDGISGGRAQFELPVERWKKGVSLSDMKFLAKVPNIKLCIEWFSLRI